LSIKKHSNVVLEGALLYWFFGEFGTEIVPGNRTEPIFRIIPKWAIGSERLFVDEVAYNDTI
jgi:hypothetical protein